MLVSTLVLIFEMNWQLSVLAVVILPLFILPTRRVGRIRHDLHVQEDEHRRHHGELFQRRRCQHQRGRRFRNGDRGARWRRHRPLAFRGRSRSHTR